MSSNKSSCVSGNSQLQELFKKEKYIKKIQEKLPELFQLAREESSKDNKVGMQVGSLRENIVIALLIYVFGESSVSTDMSITKKEVDVSVCNSPVSIKTKSTKGYSGVKLIWTVDWEKVKEFKDNYCPRIDMIFVHIIWGERGAFYYIPKEAQGDVFNNIGRDKYIKIPRQGTNPRGVEISAEALSRLVDHKYTQKIDIFWEKNTGLKFDPYKRWIHKWEK